MGLLASTKDSGPGSCNMHTADFMGCLGEVLVFRGGDGRRYLNDLHGLDVKAWSWREVGILYASACCKLRTASSPFAF